MSDAVDVAPRSRAATRQLWAERVARFPASGLTVAAFRVAEGISANAFFSWNRQFASAPPPSPDAPRLLPVRVQPAAPAELVPASSSPDLLAIPGLPPFPPSRHLIRRARPLLHALAPAA